MKKLMFLICVLMIGLLAQVDQKSKYEKIFDLSAKCKNVLQWKADGLIDPEKADAMLAVNEAEILNLLGQPTEAVVNIDAIKADLEMLLADKAKFCLKAQLSYFERRVKAIIAKF